MLCFVTRVARYRYVSRLDQYQYLIVAINNGRYNATKIVNGSREVLADYTKEIIETRSFIIKNDM